MKKIILLGIFLLLATPISFADLQLDNIYFDPAIISAGDEVDIVIQYHDDAAPFEDERIGAQEYTFQVEIQPDDTLTQEYVTFQDALGDYETGRIYAGGYYNKRFRIKVDNDAPAGSYEFKLVGQWYKNNEPLSYQISEKFFMEVKREGIILNIANIVTDPQEVHPGDDFVKITTFVENVGQKDAKSVDMQLITPQGLQPSYADNNRVWAGRVNAGEKSQATFFVDVAETIKSGVYHFVINLSYLDLDDNAYTKELSIPFYIKKRPYLEIVDVNATGLAGSTGKMYVSIQNTGEASAESVDIRIIKQNAQPFTFDVRSDYVGEIEPGETALAVFDIGVLSSAEFKDHNFQLLLRAKGDSDIGDDTIYTYHRDASFTVTGKAPNRLLQWGLLGAGLVVIVFLISLLRRKK